MKNGKFCIFYVAQWSKWSKVNLKKIWPLCYEKDLARGMWGKFQVSSLKNGKVSISYVAQWSKVILEKKIHCVMKKIRQGVCEENFRSLVWKTANIAFLMLHSGQKWSKLNLKNFWPLCFEKDQARALWWKFSSLAWKMANLVFLMLHSGKKWSKVILKKKMTTVLWKRSGKGSLVKISAF